MPKPVFRTLLWLFMVLCPLACAQGINPADLGGVQVAYDSLQTQLEENSVEEPDGLTTQVKTDLHAPGSVRAAQPLRNMDASHRAFNITVNVTVGRRDVFEW